MSLRETMPQTAEFIDALRDVFGKDAINAEIRKGIGGFANHFHASENGQESGTAFDDPNRTPIDPAWLLPTKKEKNGN